MRFPRRDMEVQMIIRGQERKKVNSLKQRVKKITKEMKMISTIFNQAQP